VACFLPSTFFKYISYFFLNFTQHKGFFGGVEKVEVRVTGSPGFDGVRELLYKLTDNI
jgi:hypothetical protein